jgi:hypothetical protein
MNQFCLGTRVTSTVTYKGRVHPIEGRISGLEVTFDREIDDHEDSNFFYDNGRDLQMQNVVFHRVEGGEEQTHVTLGPLVKEAAAAAAVAAPAANANANANASEAGGGGGDTGSTYGGRRRRRTQKKQSRRRRH